MTQLSDNALARACADSMYKRDIAAQALGISLGEVKPGFAQMKMTIREDMLNGHGICHGGFLFTLADTVFAYAGNSYNKVSVAKNCEIDFLLPGKAGDELTATAQERQRGRKTGVYDVEVRNSDAELVALFRGRSYQIAGEVLTG